jgi:hypothetical protein
MKKLLLIMFLFLFPSVCLGKEPIAEITICVVDDNGKAVADMPVGMSTFVKWKLGPGFGKDIYDKMEEKTDLNGKVTLKLSSKTGLIYYSIHRKEGYYDMGSNEYQFKEHKNGYWQPKNQQLTLVAQKKGKQIPMYARMVGQSDHVQIPKVDEPIGFDLIESDWVAPYGKGKVSDFIFKVEKRFVNDEDFDVTLTLTFSKEDDGIQSVYGKTNYNMLALPTQSPEEGYEAVLERGVHKKPDSPYITGKREDQNYFFRVRTVKKDGKIVSALYGKIHGNISISWKSLNIYFTYFLNPDGTRNMEFDQNKNLLLNIPSSERPGGP